MIRESPRGKQLPDEKEQKQNKQNVTDIFQSEAVTATD